MNDILYNEKPRLIWSCLKNKKTETNIKLVVSPWTEKGEKEEEEMFELNRFFDRQEKKVLRRKIGKIKCVYHWL